RDPRIYERQPLPLRRLSPHRQGRQPGQGADAEELTMRPFTYRRADTLDAALQASPATGSRYLARGPPMLHLMKLDVRQPETVVDINGLAPAYADITAGAGGLHLGALVRMADAADHPVVQRDYPVIAQSLALAASAQLRNMATLGGNVLQRTRCN